MNDILRKWAGNLWETTTTGQRFVLYQNKIRQKYEQSQVEQNQQNPHLCLHIYIMCT